MAWAKRPAGSVAWYLAANVAAIGPYLILIRAWPQLSPAVGAVGLVWGSVVLGALLLPFYNGSGFAWQVAIVVTIWLRTWGAVMPAHSFEPAIDGLLKVLGIGLLIGYITIPERFPKFQPVMILRRARALW